MRREINYSHRKTDQADPVQVNVPVTVNSSAPVEVQQKSVVTVQDVWLAVAAATAGALNCSSSDIPVSWANKAADGFQKRFGGVRCD